MDLLVFFLISLMGHDRAWVRDISEEIVCAGNRLYDWRGPLKSYRTTDHEIKRRLRRLDYRYRLVYPTGKDIYPQFQFVKDVHKYHAVLTALSEVFSENNGSSSDREMVFRGFTLDYITVLFSEGWTRRQVRELLDEAIKAEINGFPPP